MADINIDTRQLRINPGLSNSGIAQARILVFLGNGRAW